MNLNNQITLLSGKLVISILPLALCLFFSQYHYAQVIVKVGSMNQIKSTAYNTNTNILYAVSSDSIFAFSGSEMEHKRAVSYTSPEPNFPEDYEVIGADSTIYFVHTKGGLIYQFADDSLVRIDKSYNHNMQNMSSLFVRNDTIMRYGGYGFWTYNNFFTYFSKKTQEWEILPPYSRKELPRSSVYTQLTFDNKYLYTAWGLGHSQTEPLGTELYPEAWRFNTKSQLWEFLGDIAIAAPLELGKVNMGDRVLYRQAGKIFILVNPRENSITSYYANEQFENLCLYPECAKYYPRTKINGFYDNGVLLLPTIIHENTQFPGFEFDDLIYQLVPESLVFNQPYKIERLYAETSFPWKTAGGVLIGLSALFLWILSKRRSTKQNKIIFSEDTLVYKGERIDLDAKAAQLLRLFIQSGGTVTASEAMRLVENPRFSEGHNLKIKNHLIDTLNLTLKTLLKSNSDPIKAVRSADDRRNKSYRLDVSRFVLKS